MNSDGSLICTTPSILLYQRESLMDSIHFLLPQKYKERLLADYTILLKYVNPANVSKIEILTLNNAEYKGSYLEYVLPVTTSLTQFAGNITLHLTMLYTDAEQNQSHVGNSGEITISITPVNEYFTDKNSLEVIDRQILQLQEISTIYESSKADDIELLNGELYLKSGNKKVGTSIPIDDIISSEMSGVKTVYF